MNYYCVDNITDDNFKKMVIKYTNIEPINIITNQSYKYEDAILECLIMLYKIENKEEIKNKINELDLNVIIINFDEECGNIEFKYKTLQYNPFKFNCFLVKYNEYFYPIKKILTIVEIENLYNEIYNKQIFKLTFDVSKLI